MISAQRATDEGKIEANMANAKKHHRALKFPGIHGILLLVYPKIHAGSLTPT